MGDDNASPRRGYHHGNLRQALVEATLELVVEKGPLGFTITEAARRAGVSPGAPYRHVRGREELIEEAARQGFEIFADSLGRAVARAAPSPLKGIEAAGRAYLAFARSHPGHYITMFESGLSPAANPELKIAADRAFAVLTRAAEALIASLPRDRRPPATMVSHHIWALAHGVVELFARGTPGRTSPFEAEELLESGIGIYLRGLGLIPPDAAR
ncbi:TetR/AcrR family transcriptional regulator [Halovulum dunhuangense]|uniref:TetR/AcrR family transcriptional regulator n=1 Tax=Halovulum dunhuangense TaxID=1505036 RepID=A0A849L2F1_9RHOB|nr:TetR/AcrR family transcriptional regulator [Halovulum dunhuangense]NNU80518.1 TetR/AcrR family transcriptional regulator [Halovulum dunhuangense]